MQVSTELFSSNRAAFDDFLDGFLKDQDYKILDPREVDTADAYFLLNAEDDSIIGLIIWDEEPNDRRCLEYIYILPEHRGNGFSKTLIKAMETRNPPKTVVLISCLTRYWQKMGYTKPTEDPMFWVHDLETNK